MSKTELPNTAEARHWLNEEYDRIMDCAMQMVKKTHKEPGTLLVSHDYCRELEKHCHRSGQAIGGGVDDFIPSLEFVRADIDRDFKVVITPEDV